MDQYKKIKNLLKESTTEFFSFTPKGEKLQTMLLRGLDSSIEPEELLKMLKEKECDGLEFVGVKPFTTARAKREKRKLPFFLVQLSPNSKLDSLRSINVLDYQVVTWEKVKRSENILQCVRCQRFGHAASNCEMQPRCVKCGKNHKAEECSLGQDRVADRAQLSCALCGNSGHTANYRGCPKFQYMKKVNLARQQKVEVKRPPASTQTPAVTPQWTYAQMASGRGNTVQQQPKVAAQAPVPKAPETQPDLLAILLSIQGQMSQLQRQLELQAKRVDQIYAFLPGLAHHQS